VNGQLHAPAALLPEKKNHYTGGWVGPRAGLDDMKKENSLPYRDSNSDPLAVRPVASRYTDYAIPALTIIRTM
jgi:hypothetical protein